MNTVILCLILGMALAVQAQTPPTAPPPAAPSTAQQTRMNDLQHQFTEANLTLQLDYQKLQGLAEFQDYLATQKKVSDIQVEAQQLSNAINQPKAAPAKKEK